MKKFRNLKFSLLLMSVIIVTNANAQEDSEIQDLTFLARDKKVMIENYPGLFKEEEINKIQKLDSKHSKIFYTRGDKHFEAIVNSHREDLLLVATCEEISTKQLPAAVMSSFENSHPENKNIAKAFIVTTPYSSAFYRIDVMQDKKQMKSFFYNDLGEYMIPPY